MKIIYLHQYFNTPSMVGSTRSYEMARRLVEFGHEVHMITSWREKDEKIYWRCSEEAGVRVHWLPVPYSNEMGFYERIIAFIKFALGAARKAIELKGDVIFATSTPLTIAIPGILASKFHRIPMVFEVRDLWPEIPIAMGVLKNPILKLLARILEKIAYLNSVRIVALSPDMAREISLRGVSKKRIDVIPNSSDIDFFQAVRFGGEIFRSKTRWLKNRPLLVYCGTFGQVNGVDYLVNVAVELEKIEPNICILAVGEGKMKPHIKELASKKKVLNKNFFILDAVKKMEMPKILAAADIASSVVIDLPVLWANSANKFFDALAAGKPFLINHKGWLADLLENSKAGLVVDPNYPAKAAELIAMKINDKDWLENAGKASFRLAKERFDRCMLAKRLEKVLQKAIKYGKEGSDENERAL